MKIFRLCPQFLVTFVLGLVTVSQAIAAGGTELAATRKTCKMVYSCEEAVELWCNGYRRADGDSDGIPCENVCSTRQQVQEIQDRIGC